MISFDVSTTVLANRGWPFTSSHQNVRRSIGGRLIVLGESGYAVGVCGYAVGVCNTNVDVCGYTVGVCNNTVACATTQ